MNYLSSSADPLRLAGIVSVCLLAGCSSSKPPPSEAVTPQPSTITADAKPATARDDTDAAPQPVAIEVLAGEGPWISADRLPWEAWYLQYLNGKRIGFSHVRVSQSLLEDSLRLDVRRTDTVELPHEGAKSLLERTSASLEYDDGRLVSTAGTTKLAGQITESSGSMSLDGKTLSIVTQTGDESKSTQIAWENGAWGMLGVQAFLMRDPPQPGDFRTAKVFVQQLNRLVTASIFARPPDITSLPGGRSASLTPVDVLLVGDGVDMRSRNWVNEQGEIMKTISLNGPSLSTFRVSAEVAHRIRDEFALADLLDAYVPLTGYAEGAKIQERVYLVERKLSLGAVASDPFALIAKSDDQSVVSKSALSAEVTVRAQTSEHETSSEDASEPPADELLSTSSLVQSASPEIQELARQLAPEANGAYETSLALARGIRQRIKLLEFSQRFNDAMKVAGSREGNCAEQAVLLTAVLRCHAIPARVASGLRVDPADSTRMVFHMWTEAWVDEHWLALDATLGTTAGVDRIKFLDSPLQGENPYGVVLPVFRAMENLQITLISDAAR